MARPKNLAPARVRVYQTESGRWNVTWTDTKTGKTRHASCGTHDEEIAKQNAGAIIANKSTPKARAGFTVAALIAAYQEHEEAERRLRKQRPSATFAINLKQPKVFFTATRPDQIGPPVIQQYRRWRTEQPVRGAAKTTRTVGDNTAVRELKQVRAAIKWGQRTPGWREALVGVEFTLPDVEVVIRNRALTRNEVRRLLEALEDMPHLELFVRLAIATGARMSAILELAWDKVQWPVTGVGDPLDESRITRRVIDLRAESGEPTGLTVTFEQDGKRLDINGSEMTLTEPIRIDFGRGTGSKKRPIGLIDPRNVGLWFALMYAYKHRDPSCPYVVQYHGRGIKSVDLGRAYERVSIAGAGVHTLKHTCCTLMLLAGVHPGDVAEHVGTSEKIIRQHYKNFLPDERAKVGAPLIF